MFDPAFMNDAKQKLNNPGQRAARHSETLSSSRDLSLDEEAVHASYTTSMKTTTSPDAPLESTRAIKKMSACPAYYRDSPPVDLVTRAAEGPEQ